MKQAALGRRRFSIGLGVSAIAGFGLARAQSEGTIVLGQSAPFSGPAAQLGVQFHAGAKLYFDALNAQGGIGRRLVELRTLDDGYEPDRCAANTRKFIEQDVLALFGYVGTPTSLAALPLFSQAKVPFFAPFTGAEALRQPFNRLIFHVRASYNDETAVIVRQLTHLGLSRIAVLHQDDAYGKAGLDGVSLALAEEKLKTHASATVARNSTDVAAAVQKLVAAKPESIVMVTTYAAGAAFVRAARKAGYGGTFYNLSFVGTQALADELGKDAAGVVISQVMPSPFQTTRQIAREFQDAIKKGGSKVQANYSSMEGYVAARVFAEGLRQGGGKATRDALISGLEAIGTAPVSGYPISFSASSHSGSRFVEMSMLTGDGRVRV
ncbi:ABC transporter substrate-binding protein [Paracidovorax konjaci]|uniref:ABC-type branched-chain amino acid transport system, substrate-binding protein n=1 Tax=Paracidovorax konjaci TaxID=32040 RepID=A0A1I1VB25_9BURK|nr:ABC transporter substrate-binding protein [Paracidovorax konjaci]SFD80301.1 ABC-type branched-chain amino acid transport system, substrate-binding protein [Paracidovorax konjaci]